MRCAVLSGAVLLATSIAAAPASAWDVQTRITFKNETGVEGNPDMHGEVPNVWIPSGGDWTHTSYYTGIEGRGYHNTLTTRDGRWCRVSVLVRTDRTGGPSTGGNVYCDLNNYGYGGLQCGIASVNEVHSQKRCEFTLYFR